MKFANELYAGVIAAQSKENIIRDLGKGIFKEGYFIIVLSEKEHDLLEMLAVEQFNDPVYVRYHDLNSLHVVGLAVTKREAFTLLTEIVMDIHKKTNSFDVKEFFHFV